MFALTCQIKIADKYTFTSVHEVKVKKSIHTLGDTAVISLPLSARLRLKDGTTQSAETSQVFKAGDKVVIKLGYNGRLKTEFIGYIRVINYKKPLEIECEDYIYPLRHINIKKSWNLKPISEILQYVCKESGVTLSSEVPESIIKNFICENQTALWVLQEIKSKYPFSVYFLPDGTLYCGIMYQQKTGNVNYDFNLNVIESGDLKWQDAADVKLKIKAVSFQKNGTRLEAEVGDNDGAIRTLLLPDVANEADLKKMAMSEIKKYQYTGYRGKIKTFLEPFCEPRMVAKITDPIFPERGGSYYAESVLTTFGQSGARREVELGIKV